MKKQEKIGILVLIVISLIIIGILYIVKVSVRKGNETSANLKDNTYVDVFSDGTKLNNSTKIKEPKTLEGMKIENIQLTNNDKGTILFGTITNISNEVAGGFLTEIKAIDEKGNELATAHVFVGKLEPGESTQLNASSTVDYSNAYDLIIKRAN